MHGTYQAIGTKHNNKLFKHNNLKKVDREWIRYSDTSAVLETIILADAVTKCTSEINTCIYNLNHFWIALFKMDEIGANMMKHII